ncbi:MAG: ABC transporter permease [Nitrospirae bacterium]|nr:ABC transporter permease [Nitrospirota bacterium]
MRILRYSFQNAIKSIWREKWLNLLAVLSVSIGLSILGAFVIITLNLDSVLHRWSKSFGMVVYMNRELSREREDALEKYFKQDADVAGVKYISKEQALKEVRQVLGSNALIVDGVEENPLPSSFELTLKSELLEPAVVKNKAAQIKMMSGVEEIQYGEKWLSSLNTVSGAMKLGAVFLGFGIFTAVTFITYSTIKIFFYRRRDEIETLKLLGATRSFIRIPFMIEAFFIGFIGGVIGALATYGAYSFASLRIVEFMPAMKTNIAPMPLSAYALIPFCGAVMSIIGSLVAVGKIKY